MASQGGLNQIRKINIIDKMSAISGAETLAIPSKRQITRSKKVAEILVGRFRT